MFDQSHGLRFDIYERIHLSEELPGIAELEEVELVPDIQVIQREDRAELHGQLLLTGLYRGEDDRTQRLEHAIPVEITVPLTRVSSLDDIGVEIENFDIDLLTMRTVNITGVLSLRGIGSADAQPAWQQEEYTVAYSPEAGDSKGAGEPFRSPENDTLYENSLWTYGEGAAEGAVEDQDSAAPAEAEGQPLLAEDAPYTQPAAYLSTPLKDKEQRVRTHSLDTASPAGRKQAADPVSGHFLTSKEKTAPAAVNQSLQEDTGLQTGTAALNTVDHWGNAKLHAVSQPEPVLTSAASDAAALFAGNEEGEAAEEIQAEDNEVFLSAESLAPQEEKKDLKVALGSKKEPGAAEQEPLTFSSLLSASRANKELEDLHSGDMASQEETVPEAGNDTAWKSRFIGGRGGTDLFRKVRLCIVQREETLDTIAEKYQLSTRELSMYNRLSGQIVEEGQVLYIP
ncbi:LysM peptidoglycan-binding domain-containing protein [Paenibacillus sp. FSL K6-1217]|uniref:LysM peptidoglycan-binding domain-containing protein n=1 Tax=Paenibacillus sp. FSL K6-1217 TaxID=2921466 RepID=UPI00324B4612